MDIAYVNLTRFFRTSSFRLALAYTGAFAVSGIALLAVVYWLAMSFVPRQADEAIRTELAGLVGIYRGQGLNTLVDVIGERSRGGRNMIYLLADGGSRLAGNLQRWPDASPSGNGWISFAMPQSEKSNPTGAEQTQYTVRGLTVALGENYRLLVGKSTQNVVEMQEVIVDSVGWALTIAIALGLGGGVLLSRNVMRRLDNVNRATRTIIRGDLMRRMPIHGSGDELDQLAENVNLMLDQIERLMVGMKHVTTGIAHDLRSPLSRMRSRLEVTLLDEPDPLAYRAAIEDTIDELEGLLTTFNALLNIAQVEAGIARKNMTEVDLATLAESVATAYEPMAEAKALDFTIDIHARPTVRAHKHLLFQALANLLDNAIKYTPQSGRVRLLVQELGGRPEIVVTDSGPGIAPEDRAAALERFVRLNAQDGAGNGLGLSLVTAVATLHDIDLSLEDNAPGLRVVMRFPLS